MEDVHPQYAVTAIAESMYTQTSVMVSVNWFIWPIDRTVTMK